MELVLMGAESSWGGDAKRRKMHKFPVDARKEEKPFRENFIAIASQPKP